MKAKSGHPVSCLGKANLRSALVMTRLMSISMARMIWTTSQLQGGKTTSQLGDRTRSQDCKFRACVEPSIVAGTTWEQNRPCMSVHPRALPLCLCRKSWQGQCELGCPWGCGCVVGTEQDVYSAKALCRSLKASENASADDIIWYHMVIYDNTW